MPESQIKAFVERLAGPIGPGPAEMGIEQAKEALNAGEVDLAADIFEQVLAEEPANPEAIAGAARADIARGRAQAARERLDSVPKEHANHVEIAGAKAALSLAEEAGTLPDPAELITRLEADQNDHAARLDLATAMFLRGQTEEAMSPAFTSGLRPIGSGRTRPRESSSSSSSKPLAPPTPQRWPAAGSFPPSCSPNYLKSNDKDFIMEVSAERAI